MHIKLHKRATTTPAIREAIAGSELSAYALAKQYGITEDTARKWKRRGTSGDLTDRSSRPHALNTKLTQEHIDLILFERKQFKKTIEDIYFSLEDDIPNLYPMKIYRVLARHEMGRLPSEFQEAERIVKKFRKYGIGYLHIDLLYAPKIGKKRSYIYTAIDRVAKIAFVMIGESKTKLAGTHFLEQVISYYPYKINYILTDNGFEFSYKALPKAKKTKKIHPFDKLCLDHKIQHRTIKFKHPWTNGMVERFNRTIKEQVLRKQQFSSIFEMHEKLIEFVNRYNFEKRLKSLNYQTPMQYLSVKKNITLQRIVI